MPADGEPAVEDLARWLRVAIAARVGSSSEDIGSGELFQRCGLDSLRIVDLASALSVRLGRTVAPTTLWRHPTVSALSRHLLAGPQDEPVDPPPAAPPLDGGEPIAVVGVACRFPGADSVDRFWDLLRDGVDAVRPVPPARWDAGDAAEVDPDRVVPVEAGFLTQPIDEFDPLFFGISPREAAEMDPQQRMFLEVAWEAVESAGLHPDELRGTRSGVFAGVIWHDYADLQHGRSDLLTPHSATGRAGNMVANRLSYFLDLQGPSLVVDSACSSSLLALHLACQSLRTGEATTALAGGVNLLLDPATMVALTKFGGLAPDGRCKAFDASADGFGRGEGCGVVVLKTLSRALADGDEIWCTVAGSAVNNDGLSNGLTAPSEAAQEAVLRQAYRQAGVDPASVPFVEAHGTGTALGDPIEAGALAAVLSRGRPAGSPLVVGSVKTNIGHLEAAAGMAGLIKAILALRHRRIPPNLHFAAPNPHIDFDGLNIRVPTALEPWPVDAPAVAGVSSFGWGGTNVHTVLQGWTEPAPVEHRPAGPAVAPARPRVGFVCSPHGHQWTGMGRQLHRTDPAFRAVLRDCDRELVRLAGWSLLDELFSDRPRFERVDVAQPALFAVQVATAAALRARGVLPDLVVGHSLGEIAAAVIAGILDLPAAVDLVWHYSSQQQRVADRGDGMAAVELPADEVRSLLAGYPGVGVAAHNGPAATALSGPSGELDRLLTDLKVDGVLCGLIRVPVAAHGPAIDPVLADLRAAIAGLTPRPGDLPMISTLTGHPVDWRAVDGDYFARNLREPVLLAEAIGCALEHGGVDVLVEISANPVLVPALRQSADRADRPVRVLGTLQRDGDRAGLDAAVAELARAGAVRPVPVPAELVALSAGTPAALRETAARAADAVEGAPEPFRVADVAGSATRRADLPHRLAVVAQDRPALVAGLRAVAAGEPDPSAHVGEGPVTSRGVALVFPGQGSQWVGMGRELFDREPVFRAAMRASDAATEPYLDRSLLTELAATGADSRLDRIDVVQPVLFALHVSLAALWRSWGLRPAAVVGHSMGEAAAAHVAGVLSLEDASRIICLRSRLMRRLSGRGAMLAVELTLAEAAAAVAGREELVSVAVNNGPRSSVLSGDPAALAAIEAELVARDVFCRRVKVDVASHSPQMDRLRPELLSVLAGLTPRAGVVPFHSTVTGAPVAGPELTAGYWADNLRDPVLFAGRIEALLETGVDAFVEVSPHPILLPAVEQVAAHRSGRVTAVPSLRRNEPERAAMLSSLGRLYVAGVPADLARVATPGRRVPLPAYPWQRERHWLAVPTATARPRGSLLGERWDSPVEPGEHWWQREVDLTTAEAGDHRVAGTAVLPGSFFVVAGVAAGREILPDVRAAVSDVAFHHPLVVPETGTGHLQAVLRTSGQQATVAFYSRGADGVQRVAELTLTPTGTGTPGPVDPDALGDRCRETVSGERYAAILGEHGLDYGPAYRCLGPVSRSDTEVLAAVRPRRLPRGRSGAGTLHPTLLDAALQAAGALALGPDWGTGSSHGMASQGIERLVVHGPPEAAAWAAGRLRPDGDGRTVVVDVVVVSATGDVLVEVAGARIVRLEGMAPRAVPGSGPPDPTPGVITRRRLLAVPVEQRRDEVRELVRDGVAAVVRLSRDRVGDRTPLRELGVDSVLSLELRNRLEADFDVPLAATVVWNHPTVSDLADFLARAAGLRLDGEAGEAGEHAEAAGEVADPTPVGDDVATEHLQRELAELSLRLESL